MDLARRKALSLRPVLRPGQVVLTADTLCVDAAGRLLGTPQSGAEAWAMLRRFVAAEHRVVTGVAVMGGLTPGDEIEVFAEVAAVRWGEVSEGVLEDYAASGEWRGKAGGYNLWERVNAGWPGTVEGDEATVVGLPMRRLAGVLAGRGWWRGRVMRAYRHGL